MRRLIRCFSVVAVLAVVGLLLSGTAWAQTITITGASGVNIGVDRSDYGVAGTVAGVAGDYDVKIWIFDGGDAIDSTTVSESFPDTTWYANIQGNAGGDSTHVCLLGIPPACLAEDGAPITYPVPATSTTGMLVILLLIASVASIALWRRAASRA